MALFAANRKNSTLETVGTEWEIGELDLESFLIPDEGELLNPDIFGEEMLCISNQVKTREDKRADIFALDSEGRGVVIELKKDTAALGVDMQALQYLSSFSKFQGRRFLNRFEKDFQKNHGADDTSPRSFREIVDEFTSVPLENLNRNTRIVLLARSFDRALFSMGSWLVDQDVGFRCISYTPTSVNGTNLLHFSTEFEQEPASHFDLDFTDSIRDKGFFWHNIGIQEDDWWDFLKEEGFITANFNNAPGDAGERALMKYVKGDHIFAYSSGNGAIGYGTIRQDPGSSYELLAPGDDDDVANGKQLHRLDIDWSYVADSLDDAIPASELRDNFGISHPKKTRQSIKTGSPRELAQEMRQTCKNDEKNWQSV